MELSDFGYYLPPELIANEPAPERDASRMLAVDRGAGIFSDSDFAELPRRLTRGDILVLNNTKVFPARLLGTSETGARVEVFLMNRLSDSSWEALARPGRRLREGKRISFGAELAATIVKRTAEGRFEIEFEFAGSLDELLDKIGKTPLPPYITRDSTEYESTDRERYQTVYAKHRGAIAAPTAGLHFTGAVLDEIAGRGVELAEITLHVGYGTFEPVRAHDLSQHSVLPEQYEIDASSADILQRARREKRRIVAVGTTTTRALETALSKHGDYVAGPGVADLTITPGYRFEAIGALLTNFHLPKSSLLILVSTFGGHKLIMDAYKHAVASRYRFYSYGDCMFIE
jgi:S-adenosylmethionine:tRNA ribosyltransferase-isomerase